MKLLHGYSNTRDYAIYSAQVFPPILRNIFLAQGKKPCLNIFNNKKLLPHTVSLKKNQNLPRKRNENVKIHMTPMSSPPSVVSGSQKTWLRN